MKYRVTIYCPLCHIEYGTFLRSSSVEDTEEKAYTDLIETTHSHIDNAHGYKIEVKLLTS